MGEGPQHLVLAPGFISNIENYWDDPRCARWLTGLAEFSHLVIFDKRGTGLSDRVGELPTMEERVDDMRAVMDAVGIEQAAVMGISEGGSLASVFAAHHQSRCEALILYGAFAKFSSWFPTQEALNELFAYIDSDWGSGTSLPLFAPKLSEDRSYYDWWGKFERLGANPNAAIALMKMNSEIDISNILQSIHVPTLVIHKTEDTTVSFEGGLALSQGIPNAKLFEMPGTDHLPWADGFETYLSEIEQFLTGKKSAPVTDRVLATVMFTDIVDSTVKANALGDQAWRDLLEAHDRTVRRELKQFRGKEVKSLGDGFLATFDGPARAIHCARSIRQEVERLGINTRAGLHTGEVELLQDDVHGIAVHLASRVVTLCPDSEILVTQTVKDLVAGSGIDFREFGLTEIKGFADEWRLFCVS